MTDEAKIALLWAGFHRLPAQEQDLILKIAELSPRRGISVSCGTAGADPVMCKASETKISGRGGRRIVASVPG
jgi:hypothetical protein